VEEGKSIMNQTVYQNEFFKVAAEAAKKATTALQKIISSKTRVILTNFEQIENPEETDAKHLAERCVDYYKKGDIITSAKIKIYKDDNSSIDAGIMLMFITQRDFQLLGKLLLENKIGEEQQYAGGMKESAVTEMLNIIGNAYINVVAKVYKTTIMSMVPEIIDTMKFDNFVSDLVSGSQNKLYVIFDTELMITTHVIKMPFLLAVAFDKSKFIGN
jgi:chemotaxis protein CheY-P-specific phosphatase CheC